MSQRPGCACWIPSWGQATVGTALGLERPVVLLTSDPDDLNRLVEEQGQRKTQRIAVVHV
jgi:hypothetical protein